MRAGRPGQRPSYGGSAWRRAVAAAFTLLALVAAPCQAAEINGSAALTGTNTENRGEESESLEQQYNLGLHQRLSPYLGLFFRFQYYDFGSDFEDGSELSRRNREPSLDLVYARSRLSARLSLSQRTSDGPTPSEDFESDSLLATLSWRPLRGLGFRGSFRDQRNVADTALVGTDTSSQYLNLETFLNRAWGGASYAFQRSLLDSRSAGFDSRQNRHELRAWAAKDVLQDRVSFNATGSVSRVDQATLISEGAGFVEVVPASQGLYALDTTPEIGELDPAPDLIDGDTQTPSAPGIDIGGANTSRNIGLDLGISAQVTRLEITVDAESGASVLWEVYHSPDNLAWERVDGATAEYDAVFLRYTILFPLTTDRYFKALNVSANTEPTVQVTEARALLDRLEQTAADQLDITQTLYRASGSVSIRPNERITGRIDFGYSDDEDVVDGLARRDYRALSAGARIQAELAPELDFALGYRWADFEDQRPPTLQRTTETVDGSLRWSPLETLEAALLVQRRDETQLSDPVQSSRSARLLLSMQLLPDLRLVSEVSRSSLDDYLSGFDRRGLSWSQIVEARPVPRWTLQLRYGESDYETPAGEPILSRSDAEIRTTWNATAYVTLFGSWALLTEDLQSGERDNIRQNYGLSYNPGNRLRLSATYQEYETQDVLSTTGSNVHLGYRLGRYIMVFGNLSRSRTRVGGVETASVISSRAGLRLYF